MSTLATFQLAAAAVGFALTWSRPVAALAIFLCILGTFSSLAWHLGLPNASLALPFLLGYVFAPRPRRKAGGASVPAGLRTAGYLYVSCLTVATGLALARGSALSGIGGTVRTALAGALVTFNPGGEAGMIQTLLVALVGPMVFLRAVEDLRARSLSVIRVALVISLALVLASVVLQALFLDPTVRPDLGRTAGAGVTGIVGFFQDPHSLAAYLLLLGGVLWGELVHRARLGRSWLALLLGCLLAAGFVCLILTNSRGGLLAFGVTVLGLIALMAARGSRVRDREAGGVAAEDAAVESVAVEGLAEDPARRWRRLLSQYGLAVGAVFLLGLLFVPAVQQLLAGGLSRMGAERLAQLFTGTYSEFLAVRVRLMAWAIGAETNLSAPLWGVGPLGLGQLSESVFSVEAINAGINRHGLHNYYLQISTEFGIPALIGFLTLVLGALRRPLRVLVSSGERSGYRADVLSGIVAGQVGVLLLCLVSHPLLVAEIQGFYWIVAAYGLSSTSKAGTTPRPDVRSKIAAPERQR